MNRVALIVLVGAVVAAGCVGGPGTVDARRWPRSERERHAPDGLPDRTLSLPDGPKE